MGVALTPLIVKDTLSLDALSGKRVAVDGNGELYQFLALIRTPDGSPLADETGRITSHIVGLFYRVTRLVGDFGLDLVFCFDGTPPSLKTAEIARRREVRDRYRAEAEEARAAGDLHRAYSKSTMSSRLTRTMVDEAAELLRLLGIPVVRAPGEGEAQAAFMATRGDVWAAGSKDYDSLLFGTPRLLRFLAVSGKEFLPSKGTSRSVPPEMISSEALLAHYGISREQLIDAAILIGTDFNTGVKGVGPKKALKLVQTHERIEAMPEEIRRAVPEFSAVREIYQHPLTTEDYDLRGGTPDEDGLIKFLCEERKFSRDRVATALERLIRQKSEVKSQKSEMEPASQRFPFDF